jgi:molybdenum cofactor cytidylyltransferase
MSGTAALLLAAGESRRMGRMKALLPWPPKGGSGGTLLAHQITALKAAGVDRVVVVLGHQADLLRAAVEPLLRGGVRRGPGYAGSRGRPSGVSCAVNPHYMQGKTTSIKAGLAVLGPEVPDLLLILNVDQPRSADTLRRLLEQHRRGGCLITVPTYQGKGGHPLVLDGSLFDELREIDEASEGLRAVVRRHQDSLQRVELEAPEVLWDLNTPEQYQAAAQQ